MDLPASLERCLIHLRCPVSGGDLSILDEAEVTAVNAATASGGWQHRDGSPVAEPITMALGTRDRQQVYRIEDGIIWLLADMAVCPAAADAGSTLPAEKQVVRAFYDEFGWVKNEEGKFNDTVQFTDHRPEVDGYRRTCNDRIGRWLEGGEVLLDVASGSIPHPEYLDFSDSYATRICMDFSVRALQEARRKLGDKGLYVIGDITNLPLADGSVDAAISLHTIYHVPVGEQTKAVDELVRVTKSDGRVVIAYVWARSLAMDCAFGLRGFLGWLRRGGRASPVAGRAAADDASSTPELYFHPQNYDWYSRDIAARHRARLVVWSAISTAFQNRFFTANVMGRVIIRLVVWGEKLFPWLAGRFGQYPLFVIRSDDR